MIGRPETLIICNDDLSLINSCGEAPHKAGRPCDYLEKKKCGCIPMEYGVFCNYERQMILERCVDLWTVFQSLHKYYGTLGVECFDMIPDIVFEICQSYANELKVIRQFHNNQRGCD
ncbi:MAG: hypothetical protein FD149_1114 [Rhodospirillaceae bacterium]|nr:MAG: hypothetical protein FD149_1114 [Rhodospirillaceae bacterium]